MCALLRNIFPSRQSQTSIIFTKFIKGITYFKNDSFDRDTVYYCHELHDTCESIRTCNNAQNNISSKELCRYKYIYYLETLIWDAIYKYNTPHIPGNYDKEITQDAVQDAVQDAAHEERIIITKKEFQSCFHDCDLIVSVECNPQPFKLTIQQTYKNKVKFTEIYTRDILHDRFGSWIYDTVVICRRNNLQKDYVKFQTFYKKCKWIPLPEEGKARSFLTINSVNTSIVTSSVDAPKVRNSV
jgi:hypothetical protein